MIHTKKMSNNYMIMMLVLVFALMYFFATYKETLSPVTPVKRTFGPRWDCVDKKSNAKLAQASVWWGKDYNKKDKPNPDTATWACNSWNKSCKTHGCTAKTPTKWTGGDGIWKA